MYYWELYQEITQYEASNFAHPRTIRRGSWTPSWKQPLSKQVRGYQNCNQRPIEERTLGLVNTIHCTGFRSVQHARLIEKRMVFAVPLMARMSLVVCPSKKAWYLFLIANIMIDGRGRPWCRSVLNNRAWSLWTEIEFIYHRESVQFARCKGMSVLSTVWWWKSLSEQWRRSSYQCTFYRSFILRTNQSYWWIDWIQERQREYVLLTDVSW